jgi:hypothetical protein
MEKKSQTATVLETPANPKTLELNNVVAEIAIDAASKPKAYLEQTIVPEGGE